MPTGHQLNLCPMQRRVVVLVDFVGGEIADVDIRGEAGFERCADVAELVENDALEEGVLSDFGAAGRSVGCAETFGRIAEKSVERQKRHTEVKVEILLYM